MNTPRTNVLHCDVRVCRNLLSILALTFITIAPALADTNSWTKTSNGFWEEQAYWSLSTLPDASHDVLFNNPGMKALIIDAQTAQNYPQSMSVASLRVGAPADSLNVLMMNFSGFTQPLQAGSFTVEANGAVLMQGSSLRVLQGGLPYESDLFILGTFEQSDLSQVNVDGRCRVSSGNYFLTNGTLAVNLLLEDWGNFVQYGGANNSRSTHVEEQGQYHLYDGDVNVRFLRVADHGSFFQNGGTVTSDVDVGSDFTGGGLYVLNNGILAGNMSVPSARGTGAVEQYGGTNFAASLSVGNGSRFGGFGSYLLSNGVVAVSSSTTLRALGTFNQWDGLHTVASNIVMSGSDLGSLGGLANAVYTLHDGTLSAMNLSMFIATFDQEGGANLISGDTTLGLSFNDQYPTLGERYTLNGGFLSTSNLTLYGALNSGFDQTGGTNVILNELQICGQGQNFLGYSLSGGSLSVSNIFIGNGAVFNHSGGVINHSGVLALAEGNWQARAGAQALGPMLLADGNSNSISNIIFPADASVLQLAKSRDQAWSPTASLYIYNWHGWTSGGGETQLYFGTGANGLTSQQLSLIKFSLPGGLYPARHLSTGEIVPQIHRSPAHASRIP